MAKVQENSIAMAKKFNSPEWKKNIEDIQKNADEMSKKFNSPEWKKKIEDMKKLQESPEYKELRKKYENDLNELKKKKGIDPDKAFLLFDSNTTVGKIFLPATDAFKETFVALPSVKFKSAVKFSAIPSKLNGQEIVLPFAFFEAQPSKN